MHDGSIVFNTKIDNANVEKDLKDLERKIRSSEDSISKNENAKLPLVKQAGQLGEKLDEAKRNLDYIRQEMTAVQAAMAPGSSPADYVAASADYERVRAALDVQEKEAQDLQKEWDKINGKIDEYDLKIERSRQEIQRNTAEVGRLRSKLGKGGNSLSGIFDKAEKSANRFGKRLWEIGKSALIFNLVSSGLRSVVSYMGKVLKTNSEYTSQLAQLKGALLTAFQPIYDFILPGVIAVLKVLTAIVQVAANVLSFLSGKTVAQSEKDATALNKEAKAIDGVGQAAKDAKKQLMGFDEINKLSATDSGSGGGKSAITPSFGGIEDLSDDMLKLLGLVTAIGAGLLAWKIASAFTNSLSLAAGVALAVAGAFLYGFNWADAFINGLDWGNLAGILGGMLLVAGGLALAFGATGAAIGLLVTGIGAVVLALREWITTGELSNEACVALVVGILAIGGAISILTGNWIPILIAAVVALVLAIVTKGDEIKAVFASVIDWLKGVFQRDWTQVFGDGLGGVLNSFFRVCSEYLDGVQQVFNGLIDFVQGVFTGNWAQAWEGLAGIAKGEVNSIISVVNGMISVVVSGINALFRLLSINIPLPNGGSIGWTLPQFSVPQIPYLAQGAVIPPNREFMAVLGDQKHGNNIEAPEDLIRKIVREEAGNDDAVVELLELLIQTVQGIKVGDEVIGRAAARYQRKSSRAMGV